MSGTQDPTPGGPPQALLRALRRLLGPLVRLLLEYQITFPVFANLLKSIYVEQATRAFAIPGRPQTVSRLSLLTGIHRKDVKRLQTEAPEADVTPTSVSLGAQLVLRWTTDPEYQSNAEEPRALPRLIGDGSQPSFESLVESISKDIRPRAILDEWRRLGIATVDDEDHVHLVANAFVPEHGFDEKAYFLGRNVQDHIAATAHNLTGRRLPMLERSVYYAQLRSESVETLQTLSRELGMDALQRINRRAHDLQVADANRPDALQRMRFGVYFYHESQDDEIHDDDRVDESGGAKRDSRGEAGRRGHEEEGGSDAA